MSVTKQTKMRVRVDRDEQSDSMSEQDMSADKQMQSSDEVDASDDEKGNKGWADAINKILNVKKSDSKAILSKAKKDKDIRVKTDNNNVEIVNEEGVTVRTVDAKTDSNNDNNKLEGKRKKKRKNKRDWECMGKLKVDVNDKERERMFAAVATKGVVQLFNAVREQQNLIKTKLKEVGSSETKRDKAVSQFTKTDFLDRLKKRKTGTNKESEAQSSNEHKWKVLRDDYMMGAKAKDWDKQSDSDESDE